MTAQSTLAAALERKPPPLGGFSPAICAWRSAVCCATGGP